MAITTTTSSSTGSAAAAAVLSLLSLSAATAKLLCFNDAAEVVSGGAGRRNGSGFIPRVLPALPRNWATAAPVGFPMLGITHSPSPAALVADRGAPISNVRERVGEGAATELAEGNDG